MLRKTFSLRRLIAAQACLCLLLGAGVAYHRSAIQQEQLALELQKSGIIATPLPVGLDVNYEPLVRREINLIESFLETRFGPHYAFGLEQISISEPLEDPEILRKLTQVRSVTSTVLTDQDLVCLSPAKLIHVNLSKSSITNRAFRHLSSARSLAVLRLDDCAINDDDLVSLNGVPNLICLSVNRTQVSGAFIEATCPENLRDLSLARCPIDAHTISSIGRLHNLVGLNLTRCQFDDQMLEILPTLPNVETLTLVGTQISDPSLAQLRDKLPRLKLLDVEATQITVPAIEQLRATYATPPAFNL